MIQELQADWRERTALLLGEKAMERIAESRAAVVGVGGVGAVAAEMLVRAGLGSILLVDSDTVAVSNLNRQTIALRSTVGRLKVDVLRERLLDINPALEVETAAAYVDESNVAEVLAGRLDCVVDAIDTLSPKTALVTHCLGRGVALVSAMGAGAKFDVASVRIADISRTRMCPLAHMLRKRLHKMGITTGFTAVYSEEEPVRESIVEEESRNKKSQVGTAPYLPAVFGCACAQAALSAIAGVGK